VDGGRQRGVGGYPGAQQLVDPQAQIVEDLRVDVADRPVGGRGDHRVEQPEFACGTVGQFGGEGGVAAADAAVGEQFWQQQVGVGLALAHRAQHIPGHGARRIDRALTAAAGLTAPPVLTRTRAGPGAALAVAAWPATAPALAVRSAAAAPALPLALGTVAAGAAPGPLAGATATATAVCAHASSV